MDIKNPEYILEIARQQSVTRAAQKLFITQSTLSQYLLKLESELNTPLFIREKNRLVPTGAGQVYIQAAQAVVKIQDAAQARIAALKDEGSIRLGSSAWGLDLVVDTLPAFKERFPAFTVRIYENRYAETKAMMRAGTLDLAIIAVTEDDDLPAQGYTPLCQEELSLILPVDHPFCTAAPGRTHITVDVLSHELGGVSYLFSDVGSTIRRIEEKIFENLMFRPNVVCEMNRDDFPRRMVINGMGAAFIPWAAVRQDPAVRAFRFDPPVVRQDILVFRKGIEKTEPLRCLEEELVSQAQARERMSESKA